MLAQLKKKVIYSGKFVYWKLNLHQRLVEAKEVTARQEQQSVRSWATNPKARVKPRGSPWLKRTQRRSFLR
ncbi:hypothetical protein E2C01_081064 [Portunus trituberculatus]|uniref:Uncharacterized protein n=1 Tax=Portunus trituberculatus TaxID=210409 RepID=A0A5B7IQZ4_PORTR|nr:hypothetical protein [Portunus trituberculatus]